MTILIADTFTAANGTAISGRTPDTTVSSRTWSTGKFFGYTAPSGTVDIQNNKARITTSDEGFSIDCGQSDYSITYYVTMPSSFATAFRGGVRFRMQNLLPFSVSTQVDYYFFTCRFDQTTSTIRLVKVVDTVETILGTSVDYTFSTSTTYKLKAVIQGTSYSFYVDDVLQRTDSDSTYSTGSIIGFGPGTTASDFNFDDIQISTLSNAVPVFYHQLQQQNIS